MHSRKNFFTRKKIIFIFLVVTLIFFFTACIEKKVEFDGKKCLSSEDCILFYVGEKECAPCDLSSSEFKCINKGSANQILIDREKKFATIACAPCPTPEIGYECTCENKECKKVTVVEKEFNETNESESLEIARKFLINSPTYKFDGFDLKYLETITMRCPYCWVFIFEFKSRHSGYGDRTGKILAQVITPHKASIIVQEGEIISAILNEKWDELNQKFLDEIKASLTLNKERYLFGEEISFTFTPGSRENIYLGGQHGINPWSIYKFENNKEWNLIPTGGSLFGCRATGCYNDKISMLCIDPGMPYCEKVNEDMTYSWDQSYWAKEKKICGNETYELDIKKQVDSGKYKIRFKYANDSKCENFKFIEKEFTILQKETKECSFDIDCAQEESKCADGIDPYHKCIDGNCKEITFIRDPCLEHICPKGNWHRKTESTCFRYENCAEKGCNDNSETTIDECVSIGTRSEGCLYTIVNRCNLKPDGGPCEAYFKKYYFDSNEEVCKEFIYGGCDGVVPFETLEECQKTCEKKYSCEKDSECVPEQCCHPFSCVNKNFAPNCEGILCTMSCEGPIDCGAGRCACKNNKCVVEKLL